MNFDLKKALNEYKPEDPNEQDSLEKIRLFLDTNDNCFSRTNLKGHVTASALIIDTQGNVLLNHHKALNKWLQFGGHSDGEANSLNVAKREVMEETGIVNIDDLGGKIFDVDVHLIPENKAKNEPAHYHYDIRFLFITKEKQFKISDESTDIQWLSIENAKEMIDNPSMLRMLDKAYLLYRKINIDNSKENTR